MASRRSSTPRVTFAPDRTPMVLPELAGRRQDGTSAGAWQVRAGAAARGEAWTNHGERTLQAPIGDEPHARAIRMHEQMHAVCSPTSAYAITSGQVFADDALPHLSSDVVRQIVNSCEEIRMNWLATRALEGVIDYAAVLTDGSEKAAGERAGKLGNYQAFIAAAVFGIGLMGTNAFHVFVRALGKAQPEWADLLRAMHKAYKKAERNWAHSWRMGHRNHISGTVMMKLWHTYIPRVIDGEQVLEGNAFLEALCETEGDTLTARVPQGYYATLQLAVTLGKFLPAAPKPKQPANKQVREANAAAGATWQPLAFGDVPLSEIVRGASAARKVTYSNSGVQFRSAQRWTTDPQRRAFGRKVRTGNAVVVFDLSGSMSLSDEQIEAMLTAAPNGTLIGYAGVSTNSSDANAWVLARNGKRVASIDALGNRSHGNACDGAALMYGIAEAKRMGNNTPVIWVTDGAVTDANNEFSEDAFEAAAEIVNRHRVIVLPDSDVAVRAFSQPAGMRRYARIEAHRLRKLVRRELGGTK